MLIWRSYVDLFGFFLLWRFAELHISWLMRGNPSAGKAGWRTVVESFCSIVVFFRLLLNHVNKHEHVRRDANTLLKALSRTVPGAAHLPGVPCPSIINSCRHCVRKNHCARLSFLDKNLNSVICYTTFLVNWANKVVFPVNQTVNIYDGRIHLHCDSRITWYLPSGYLDSQI